MKKVIYILLLFTVNNVFSQKPVISSADNLVNPLTGDFNYSIPIVSVPGPNGEYVLCLPRQHQYAADAV